MFRKIRGGLGSELVFIRGGLRISQTSLVYFLHIDSVT